MRWPLRRTRTRITAQDAAPGPAVQDAAAAAPPRPEGGAGWAAVAALRPSVLPPAPVAVSSGQLPDVSGTRSLLHRQVAAIVQDAPIGRVEGLTSVRPQPATAVPVPPVHRRPLRLGRPQTPQQALQDAPVEELPPPARRALPALEHLPQRPAPLTEAVDAWVGEAQEPPEPYRAPGWLRAAANAPFLSHDPLAGIASPSAPEEPLQGGGLLDASWTAPWLNKPASAPPAATDAGTVSEPHPPMPAPARKRNLGQSRRFGLGTPFSRPPGDPFTPPAHTEADDGDDEAEDDAGFGDTSTPVAGELRLPPAPQPPGEGKTHAPSSPVHAPLQHPPAPSIPEPAQPPAAPAPAPPAAAVEPVYRAAPGPPAQAPPAQIILPPPDPPGVERVPPTFASAFQATYQADISRVPVFRGPDASSEARRRGTRAFSRGGAVYLPAEEGPLDGPKARPLLGHELVHVVQQRTLGPALPSRDSLHGRALEAQAQAAESTLSSAAGSAASAHLTHSPALDPTRYAMKLAEELVRQGAAHHDGAGNVVIGSNEPLDSVDSSATATQHYSQDDLLDIKLKVLSELRKVPYSSLLDLGNDYDITVANEELQRWADPSVTKDDLLNHLWLKNTRVDAMNAARHLKDNKIVSLSDLDSDSDATAEIDRQVQLFNTRLEGDSLAGGSGQAKMPKVLGMTEQEADAALKPVRAVVGTVIKRRRESPAKEKTVIGVLPPEGASYFPDTEVVLFISTGPTHLARATEVGLLGAQLAASTLGFKLQDKHLKQMREWAGITEEQDAPEPEGEESSGDGSKPKPSAGGKTNRKGQLAGKAAATGVGAGLGKKKEEVKPGLAATPTQPGDSATGGVSATPPALPTGVAQDGTSALNTASATGSSLSSLGLSTTKELRMPEVLGKSRQEAEAALKKAGITDYQVHYRDDLREPDTVIAASPPKDTFLGESNAQRTDVTVDLVVARRPTSGREKAVVGGAAVGTHVANLLAATAGVKLSKGKQKRLREAFGITDELEARSDDATSMESSTLEAEGNVPAATGAGMDAAGSALRNIPGMPPALPTQGPSTSTDLDLDRLADQIYRRIRSRVAQDVRSRLVGELRNDRARAGKLSDFR